MRNPSTATDLLHPTQVRLKELPLEVVHNFNNLAQSDPPGLRLIEQPMSWLGFAIGGSLGIGSIYISSQDLELFHGPGLILLFVIIGAPLIFLVIGIRATIERARSPLPPGLYLAKAHLLIVRRGVLTCLPRSRIRTMRTTSDIRGTVFLLDDGTKFDYEIVAYRVGPIGKWLDMAQGVDADWPPEIFGETWSGPERKAPDLPMPTPERYSSAILPEEQGTGSSPRRYRISSLTSDRYQELRDLVRKKRPGIRIPYEISDHRYSFTFAVVLLLFPWILAYEGAIPSVIQVIGSVSLAILPLLWMWKDIDFRYLSRLRPGVYLDSRHLFVVYPDDVIVVGLRGLRIGRDVQEVYGYSSGAEVELEAGGCRFDIWVSTSKFVELLKAHLLSIANQTGTDGKILDGGEDPWLALASTQEDPAAAKRGRIRRTAKAMVLIWLGFCLLNLFAGQAFGYWMLLQNYKSGHNRTAVLKSVREEVPEWYRSRLEREVWTIVQRTHTISELIWFLNWRGSHDFRLIAEANLRSLAGAKLSRGQGAVDSASPLLQAWLSQVTQTGLWRIRVSVRDSAPTWPRELFEGEDPNALVGAYDSIFVKSAFDAISEQAHLPDSLPLGIHSASDTSLPLLMVESVPLDSTGASGEAFRRWRVALPDGSTLMDLRLPVDAWQMSQLGLSAQESALGEYLRSAMRQKLDPSMDSAGKAWKESGQ